MDANTKTYMRIERMIETLTNTRPKIKTLEKAVRVLRMAQTETEPEILQMFDRISDREIFCYAAHHYE